VRILKFNAQSPGERGAGILRGDDDVEIRLDWADEDSLPDLIEIFRAAIREAFDTPDVLTAEERAEEYKHMETEAILSPLPVCEECGAEEGRIHSSTCDHWRRE
jgi:hypothetical protein